MNIGRLLMIGVIGYLLYLYLSQKPSTPVSSAQSGNTGAPSSNPSSGSTPDPSQSSATGPVNLPPCASLCPGGQKGDICYCVGASCYPSGGNLSILFAAGCATDNPIPANPHMRVNGNEMTTSLDAQRWYGAWTGNIKLCYQS